ncbi:MAG TPA: transposase [Paenibacillus sp.]|uniref:transposase n=1 Tax=Paenibacillus sp. TaxID=58172 RepID=UPI002C6C7D31|nr:transposase [Paenibacillus sp.]HUC93640.1 transposase [Paenibacillus sp.]
MNKHFVSAGNKCLFTTCFITNDSTIPETQVIQKYREKNKVEEAFREMKSQLSLRPIHLTRPERVKAHVSVCVLAYLLRNTMEMMLRQAGCMDSPEEVLKQLQSCQLNLVGFEGQLADSITMTKMTEQQTWLTDILQCNKYLQPKAMQLLTKSLKTPL